jgi:trehalose synthase
VFNETSEANAGRFNTYGDIVFIHDPQPITLVKKRAGNRWIGGACGCILPESAGLGFLQGFISEYDAAVFSAPSFRIYCRSGSSSSLLP